MQPAYPCRPSGGLVNSEQICHGTSLQGKWVPLIIEFMMNVADMLRKDMYYPMAD